MEGYDEWYLAVIAVLAVVALFSISLNIWLAVSGKALRLRRVGRRVKSPAPGENTERLGAYSDAASEWLWETGPDLRFNYVSQAYEKTSNLHPEDILGRRREELSAFDPTDEKWIAHIADLEARRPFWGFVYAIRGPDGSLNYYSVSGEPRYDSDGVFLGYRGAGGNITRTITTERQLRQSEERFRAVMDHAPFMIVLKDAEGRYVEVNRAWENRYGLTNEEIVGKTVLDINEKTFGKPVHAIFGSHYAEQYAEHDRAVLQEGEPLETENYTPDPDGTIRNFLAIRFPMPDSDGNVVGLGFIGTDITERKEAEQALRDSEEQIRTITDNLPVMVTYRDRDERYRFVNRVAERWYARPAGQILGRQSRDLLEDISYERIRPHIEAVLSGHGQQFEVRAVYPDGVRRDLDVAYIPDITADGEVRGWFGLVQDITGRKAAEAALHENMRAVELLHHIATAANEAVDVEQAIQVCLDEVCAHTGWPAGHAFRLAGDGTDDVIAADIWHLDDAEGFRAFRQATEGIRFAPGVGLPGRVLASGEPAWITDVTADPGYLRAAVARDVGIGAAFAFPVLTGRKVAAVLEFYVREPREPDRDLLAIMAQIGAMLGRVIERQRAGQALRESETRLKAIIDNSPAAIYLKDLEGRFLLANKEYLNWYGLARDSVRGKTSYDLFPDEAASAFTDQDRTVIESGKVVEREDEIVEQDGTVRTIVINKFPVFDPLGALVAVGGVDVDITERKRLQAELLRNERLAAMGQLTGTVAHELRNPLGAIASSVSVIRYKSAEAKLDLGRALDRVERSIRRCDNIITELLDFARAKGLQPSPTVLDSWLSDVVAEQEIPADVAAHCDFQTAGAVVNFDRDELRRAVINVIDNACQAMAEGNGGNRQAGECRLTISTRKAGERIEILLADTGPGISPDDLSKVMEPLYSTKAFGTGLGLPTVQRIMEEHGGGMELSSVCGRGTQVLLWLPPDRDAVAGQRKPALQSEEN